MSVPSFVFDDFIRDVASTIAEHLSSAEEALVPHSAAPEPVPLGTPRDVLLLDHEKIVWHYPDFISRIIDEVR